jgi:hypothetical protein
VWISLYTQRRGRGVLRSYQARRRLELAETIGYKSKQID